MAYEFPKNIFSKSLVATIEKIATAYGTNFEPVAVSMISILSAAIGNVVRVSPKEGWSEAVFIWAIVIGNSGSGKTPMVNKLLSYLYARQSESYQIYKEQMDEYEKKMMRVSNRTAEFRKPQLIRFMVSDITIESLASAMEFQPRGILSYQEELAGWFKNHDKYKGGDKERYLNLWSCSPWLRDRVKSSQFIRNTGLSLLGGIQPRVLPNVFQDDSFINGIFPRFLLTTLVAQPYSKLVITDEGMSEWNNLIRDCYCMPLQKDGDNIHYRVIKFSPGAHDIFADFSNELKEKRQGLLEVFVPKLISYTVRISGILHILRGTKDKDINVDVIRDSINLIFYFFGQVKDVLALYGEKSSQYSEQEIRLISILKLLEEKVADGLLSVDNITQEFNKGRQDRLCLDNQKIAYRLIDLGFRTRRTRGYSYLVWEQKVVEKLFLTVSQEGGFT